MASSFDSALREAQSEWMDLDGVEIVGEGHGGDGPVIDVFVSIPLEQAEQRLPERFRGYPVVIHASGTISAQ